MLWKWAAAAAAALALAAFGIIWAAGRAGITDAELLASLPSGFAADPAAGEILYHMGGCADCHSDPEGDGLPSGGIGLETAFGTFFAPNITPDPETGLGNWSESDFVNAMHEGISPAGRHYYPAFPYTSYALVSAEDLMHLKAFLDTLPPVSRPSKPQEVSFPFSFRPALAFWKLAAHREQPFEPDPEKSYDWNRGAYIVNGLGHCGSCHTPRNLILAESQSKRFAGAEPLKRGEKPAPRIAGIKEDDVLNALNEWAGAVDEKSSMFLVTRAFSSHVPFEDHEAIAAYLADLPPN